VIDTVLRGYSAANEQGSIGFCGVYLVSTPDRRILFDCGHAGRRRALLAALAKRELTIHDIDTLVLSHGHYDHLQNADLFAHADVLMHPAERARLAAAPQDDPVTPPWSAAILAALRVRDAEDGLTIAPGVTVIELPGHTAGSIGLAVETVEETALLTGDAVPSANSLRRGTLTAAVDAEAAVRSIRLVKSRADLVFPGHDRPFRVAAGEPGAYLLPEDHPPGGA
jgi:glyoxylase-like metal-dependent hydrolase (beta-lactamase superfamily II)